MTECDEVAASMLDGYIEWLEDGAVLQCSPSAYTYVRCQMLDESEVVISNVAEALYERARAREHEDPTGLAGTW